jgi:hypothetical protein
MKLNRRLAIENFSNHSIIVNVFNVQHFRKSKCLTNQTKLFTKQEPNEVAEFGKSDEHARKQLFFLQIWKKTWTRDG